MGKNGKLKIEKNDDGMTCLIALVTDYKKSIGRPQPIQLELF